MFEKTRLYKKKKKKKSPKKDVRTMWRKIFGKKGRNIREKSIENASQNSVLYVAVDGKRCRPVNWNWLEFVR